MAAPAVREGVGVGVLDTSEAGADTPAWRKRGKV